MTLSRPVFLACGVLLVAACGMGSNQGSQPATADAGTVPANASSTVDAGAPNGSDGGTDSSGAVYTWHRSSPGDMPDAWQSRDGAQMVQLASGRLLFIGGWSAYEPWGPNYVPDQGGGDRVTNEVWASDDKGSTWSLLLAHDPAPPTSGPGARFPPGHTVGVVTYNGHAVVMGSDGSGEDDLIGDVWQESDNGATWTRVATNAPTFGRALYMCTNFKGDIYVMGGQDSISVPASAHNDVYRSKDGGLTWTQLANAPWSPRGMIYRPAESNGKLFVIGGGNYSDEDSTPQQYNGVYTFDGTTWETVLPEGHTQFGNAFYQPLIALDGRLWLFNGYDVVADTELSRAMVSDDDGRTWTSFEDGSGGDASHADATVVAGDTIIRVSGNLSDRTIWRFSH